MNLDLDPRQRAMLQEMGVRVWSPASAQSVDGAAQSPVVRSAPTPANQAGYAVSSAASGVAATAKNPSGTALVATSTGSGEHRTPSGHRPPGIDSMDWDALQAAVQTCQACGLCQRRQHTVFGMGGLAPGAPGQAPRASWLIVGEAPGEQEDLRGQPFVGPAGQLLDNMLRAIGLDRHRQAPAGTGQAALGTYIANVLKCRPPGNRNPEPAEVSQCQPYLQRQIELLQPQLILAMGRFAAQTLLHDTVPEVQAIPLGKLRGSVHQYRGIPVVVTYHPAYLLRALGDKAKAWADLCLAVETYQRSTAGAAPTSP